jgi:PAB-dependent poly(A)-specific ribonuclease subunit 2
LGRKTYQPLDPNKEHPGPGTIIAIDTEFVSIRQPEIEINSDGDRATIRPTVYALARVSVIRGPSPAFISTLEPGTPFIDDYISTTEPIVDYLTSYSGIVAGDLDPRTSPHNVVPLKHAYKKLWLLLNLGCVFLGHGLKQDFRVINIQVPKSQVIDTAEFFFVAARLRKLSLAFLAWYLLKEEIQQVTHDSIEDARTALKLWAKYEEFVDAGVLDTMLNEIYKRGREMGFKPPPRKVEAKADAKKEKDDTLLALLGHSGGGDGLRPGSASGLKKGATVTISAPEPASAAAEKGVAIAPPATVATATPEVTAAVEDPTTKEDEDISVTEDVSASQSMSESPEKSATV